MAKMDYSRRTNRYIGYKKPMFKNSDFVINIDSKMKFGKYVGYLVSDILKINNKYLIWLHKNSDIRMSKSLVSAIYDK